MSLGIFSIWRARPQRPGLWIPREPFSDRSRHSLDPKRSTYSTLARASRRYGQAALTEIKQENRKNGLAAELKKMDADLEWSYFTKSVLVKPFMEYENPEVTRLNARRRYKSISAQVSHERNRRNLHFEPTDWRRVLEWMGRHTPTQPPEWIEDGMMIEVPEEAFARILDDVGDDKIGAIRKRTGAAIKVSRDQSTFLVSGSLQAINRTTEEFMRITGRITITRLYSPLAPGEAKTETIGHDFFVPPLSREEGRFHFRHITNKHAYRTPVPMTWTPQSFEEYIAKLHDSDVHHYKESEIYKPSKTAKPFDHEGAVANRIHRAFLNRDSQSAASCSALKLAFKYLCDKGDRFLPLVRSIFVAMDQRGLRMDVDVFNMMLKAPVRMRNLRKFHQTLKMMRRHGFAPNAETWLLFMRMFESVEVRGYILRAMSVKNLLGTPEIIQRIAGEMARFDAEHAVREGMDLNMFMQGQTERYGASWLTKRAGNHVLEVFCRHGRFEDAFRILDLMAKRHSEIPHNFKTEKEEAKPNTTSFNIIINQAKVRRKMHLAVNVLRKMQSANMNRKPDEVTLHLLFEIAWRSRLRTALSVIWRYASLARLTNWRMRQRVATLIMGPMVDLTYKISPSTYSELGGEKLARDLVGGRLSLQRLRLHSKRYPRLDNASHASQIAATASKAIPVAFEEYGPAIPLGTVLAQAMLVDRNLLRAKTTGQLRELLRGAKVKNIPLWKRIRPREDTWADLAPPSWDTGETITPEDMFQDEWDSEGWESQPREAAKAAQSVSKPDPGDKKLAIIDPKVWADDSDTDADLAIQDEESRTEVQKENERAILAAL